MVSEFTGDSLPDCGRDVQEDELIANAQESLRLISYAFAAARSILNGSQSACSLEGEPRFLAEVSTARLVLERMDHFTAVEAMERQQEIEKLEAVYGGRVKVEEVKLES